MTSKRKIKLSWIAFLWYFLPIVLQFVFTIILFYWKYYLSASILFGLTLMQLVLQNKRLYYKIFKATITEADLKLALKSTSKELNWDPSEIKNGKVITYRRSKRFKLKTERIEIVLSENKLYLNSIKSPTYILGLLPSKRNHENIHLFVLNSAHVVRDENIDKKIEERKYQNLEKLDNDEWKIDKRLEGIIGLSFSIIFLIIQTFLILEIDPENFIPTIFLVLALFFIVYIYFTNDRE